VPIVGLMWQWAPMAPAWARWLPCSVAPLRVVPALTEFPASAWDLLPEPMPWDEPAWCDPGDVVDWVSSAQAKHDPADAVVAEEHARKHYENVVALRSERITAFTMVCERSGVAVPHTLRELLPCLVALGLYGQDEDGQGGTVLRPRLARNPLDVLPLTLDEALEEVRTQHMERITVVGIGLRRLAEQSAGLPLGGPGIAELTATLRLIGGEMAVPAGQVRDPLTQLSTSNMVVLSAGVDIDALGPDEEFGLSLSWPDFAARYPFDELPAPEHMM
jgi:hypothetical protein